MSMAWFLSCFVIHVFEYMLDGISSLFEFNNYTLVGKAYSIMLYVAGLSFRDISERYCVTMASWGEC